MQLASMLTWLKGLRGVRSRRVQPAAQWRHEPGSEWAAAAAPQQREGAGMWCASVQPSPHCVHCCPAVLPGRVRPVRVPLLCDYLCADEPVCGFQALQGCYDVRRRHLLCLPKLLLPACTVELPAGYSCSVALQLAWPLAVLEPCLPACLPACLP